MKAPVNHLNQSLRAVNTGGGEEDGGEEGIQAFISKDAVKMCPGHRCLLCTGIPMCVHSLHVCVVPECFPTTERPGKGKFQRVLGKHCLPGVKKFQGMPVLGSC